MLKPSSLLIQKRTDYGSDLVVRDDFVITDNAAHGGLGSGDSFSISPVLSTRTHSYILFMPGCF